MVQHGNRRITKNLQRIEKDGVAMYGMVGWVQMPNRLDVSVSSQDANDIFNLLITNWHKLPNTKLFWTNDSKSLRIVAEHSDVMIVCDLLESLLEK